MTDGDSPIPVPEPSRRQEQETVRMLRLAAGQVEAAVQDSNASVAVLTDSFTSLAGTLEAVEAALASLPAQARAAVANADVDASTRDMACRVQQSIMAFQFYDRLVQRLTHVCQSLASLSELVGDVSRIDQPGEWLTLQATVHAMCTMSEERDMFDAVMGGASVAEALASHQAGAAEATGSAGGDIELF